MDFAPAVYPASLDLNRELGSKAKPAKKRNNPTFDEVSNVIIEGVGEGPLKTGRDLEVAAERLKLEGKVELWSPSWAKIRSRNSRFAVRKLLIRINIFQLQYNISVK